MHACLFLQADLQEDWTHLMANSSVFQTPEHWLLHLLDTQGESCQVTFTLGEWLESLQRAVPVEEVKGWPVSCERGWILVHPQSFSHPTKS